MSENVPSPFTFTTTIGIRLRDFDPLGHVNNGVYATYLEEAREDYFQDVMGKGLLDVPNTVTAKQTIEYDRPVTADTDTVEIAVRVPEVGETSIPLEYEIRNDNTVVATATTIQVVYDTEADRSRPVPDEWREAIEAFETDSQP